MEARIGPTSLKVVVQDVGEGGRGEGVDEAGSDSMSVYGRGEREDERVSEEARIEMRLS